jgi:Holliday junction resolvase RusA-like endonuclease
MSDLPLGMNDSTITDGTQALSLEIFGEPASKANSRRVVKIGSMSRVIKSHKALTYSEMFRRQAPRLVPLEGDVRVTMHIYYASRRPDLDESLVLDLMQGVAYVNDRQVKEKHIYWHLDPDNPRSLIHVEQLPAEKKMPRRTKARAGAKGAPQREEKQAHQETAGF